MKNYLIPIISVLLVTEAFAQDRRDTAETLSSVIVRSFYYNNPLSETPAAISLLNRQELNRFNNTSLVAAINTVPGIRMEERSPGSYRLNIRGSSLRAPFGVRNVKVYYNNIPFTDPGGNTFFNQLGYYNFQSLEIIKGPGSSLYGAGTGGVILINSLEEDFTKGASINFSYGSYQTVNRNFKINFGSDDFRNTVSFSQLNSEGYRNHTQLERINFNWDAGVKLSDKGKLQASLLYGDLYYQTPGALTYAQYLQNPKAARPAAGPSPSSEAARAAIYTKTFLSGFSYEHQFTSRFSNITSLYAAFSELKNPTIRNYEKRTEPHFGGRTMLQYEAGASMASLKFQAGMEFQQGLATVNVNGNVNGRPDTLQSADEFSNRQLAVFVQLISEINSQWVFSAGASINKLSVKNNRYYPLPSEVYGREYENEIAPRLAILRKLNARSSVYASVSKGFSPPSNGEILPSVGQLNYELEAETGVNYEAGFRGAVAGNRLSYDVNLFYFNLKNAITIRRDAFGAEYFVNSGITRQAGAEAYLKYRTLTAPAGFLKIFDTWASYTLNNFKYKEFQKGEDDFSGNMLPGVPRHGLSAGIDIGTKTGSSLHIIWSYTDAMMLNDANTDKAAAYQLLDIRVGQAIKFNEKLKATLFFAGNNLGNVTYGTGHDLNAFGLRYYNASPGINFTGGISVNFNY